MADPAALIASYGSPLYVYDAAELRSCCRALVQALPRDVDILYAMKANANQALLRVIESEGLGIDAVSSGEVIAALRAGFASSRISYNGNNVDDREMRDVREAGVHVTVDSLSQLDRYGRLFPGTTVGVRINPDVGDGHHDHVITGGPESKFGIDVAAAPSALEIAHRHELTIDGLQQHIGSGILDPERMLFAVDVLLRAAAAFPDLEFLDFGGGLGVAYHPNDPVLDLAAFGRAVGELLERFQAGRDRPLTYRFEPGRSVVATCGTLLVRVTAVKRTGQHVFVGVDSGFNHLLRPTLYGSYHHIENLTRPDAPLETVRVAGNICESGDLLARDRELPRCEEGDLLAVRHAGAYGYAMASNYNLRPRPAEVLVDEDTARLVRRRETMDDLLGRA